MDTKQKLVEFWKTMNLDHTLLLAFEAVPREQFVPPALKEHAYDDHPVPTLRKQSLSQPSTIMIMLKALDVRQGHNVFEAGAGVGYQAALLSYLVGSSGHVTSAEIIPELVQTAKNNLTCLGRSNTNIIESDGSAGLPEQAPFDRIIITAACPGIPPPLVDQLQEGGIIVAPVGDLHSQMMVKGTKINGRIDLEFLGSFVFVPLQGKYGFKDFD